MTLRTPEIVCFGEALADCFPDQTVIGGAPLNVARHLAHLGCSAHIMTALGRDTLADQIMEVMDNVGVKTDLVQQTSLAPTGKVRVEMQANGSHEFHIETDSAWDWIESTESSSACLTQADCLIYGTLALRKPVNQNTLRGILKAFQGLIVCDFNWREGHLPLPSAIELIHGSHCLKLNENELDMLLKHLGFSEPDQLLDAFNLRSCLITKGSEGYELLTAEGTALYGKSYPVGSFADSVGAGDSFLACTLASHLQGCSMRAALDIAAQMAAGICTVRGSVPSDKAFYAPFLARIQAEKTP